MEKKITDYPEEEIKNRVLDLIENCKKGKLKKYTEHYPKTVSNLLSKLKPL